MLTIAHADRGRPYTKRWRVRNGYVGSRSRNTYAELPEQVCSINLTQKLSNNLIPKLSFTLEIGDYFPSPSMSINAQENTFYSLNRALFWPDEVWLSTKLCQSRRQSVSIFVQFLSAFPNFPNILSTLTNSPVINPVYVTRLVLTKTTLGTPSLRYVSSCSRCLVALLAQISSPSSKRLSRR